MKQTWKIIAGFVICLASAALVQAGPPKRITVQLDWVAEPEHGGFYQALAKGFFREEGLDVDIVPGGPNGNVMQKVASGRADLGQADSTNAILAIAEGAPIVNVGAVFQNDPSVLMLHAENPVKRFEDLNGKTIMARPEWAFLPYLKKKYGIDFKIVPQNFSVANFVVDRNFIQQGYFIAEPYHIVKGGASMPKFLYAWDAGFDAYTVLIANKPWADVHGEDLRAFMRAYIRGWNDYLQGDPAPAHALMKKANANNTDEFLAYSRGKILEQRLVEGRDPQTTVTGRISQERFRNQIKQLEDLGILKPGKVSLDEVMTTKYLP